MTRHGYDSDTTEVEWKHLSPIFEQGHRGRPRKHPTRIHLNAIWYVAKTGCQWRQLPRDFPPWQSVFYYFNLWSNDGKIQQAHDVLRRELRKSVGRDENPSAAIIDSQSVKGTEQSTDVGYDAGKRIKGRKRHIIVDTLGLIIALVVHGADVQDRDGAKLACDRLGYQPRLELIWADKGYRGQLVEWVKKTALQT